MNIPFPSAKELILGGHVAFGYDDKLKIKNLAGGDPTTGALLIRNSWGEEKYLGNKIRFLPLWKWLIEG